MSAEVVRLEPATISLQLHEEQQVPAPIREALTVQGFTLVAADLRLTVPDYATPMLANPAVVLVNVTQWGEGPSEVIQLLKSARSACAPNSHVLCFSTARRSLRFVLKLMEQGVRYARVSDASMLLEAVELILAEEAQESKRIPTFRIVHKFSQGTCAPGEEVAAVQFVRLGKKFQLHLALVERLVFNLFGQNRSVAMDSAQIVSGLGDWFYREHARNSGKRQIAKVRIPTIKVIVQRIRRSMALAFDQAGASFNPYNVLNSFRAEGSTRALYKLNAAVHLEHTPLQKEEMGGNRNAH